MPPPAIDAIRQALASGEFPLAEGLWRVYAARLEEELRRGSLTQAALEQARELVEWSRLTVLCKRAHWQARLASMRVAGAYDYAPKMASSRLIQRRF